jgi:hypothetical protein
MIAKRTAARDWNLEQYRPRRASGFLAAWLNLIANMR